MKSLLQKSWWGPGETPSDLPSPAWRRALWVFLFIHIACLASYGREAILRHPILVSRDSAGYVALASSLREEGRYVDRYHPDQIPHRYVPPLYPAMLTPFYDNGTDFKPMAELTLVFSAAALLLLAAWLERRLGAWCAIGMAITFSFSEVFQFVSVLILTDAPFLAFLAAAFLVDNWAARRATADRAPFAAAATGLLAGLCFLLRSVGLAVVIAGGLSWGWAYLRRRARFADFVAWIAGAALPTLPWLLWTLTVQGDVRSGGTQWHAWRQAGAGGAAVANWTAYLWQNIVSDFASYLPAISGGVFTRIYGSIGARLGMENAFWVAGDLSVLALCIVGLVLIARRGGVMPALFAAVYAPVILAWGQPSGRFLLPLIPLVHAGFLVSIWEILSRAVPHAGLRARTTILVLLVVLSAASRARVAPSSWEKISGPAVQAEQANMAALMETVNRLTPPDAVIISPLVENIGLYTGRRGVYSPLGGETLAEVVRSSGATYVVGMRNHWSWPATSTGVADPDLKSRIIYDVDPWALWNVEPGKKR